MFRVRVRIQETGIHSSAYHLTYLGPTATTTKLPASMSAADTCTGQACGTSPAALPHPRTRPAASRHLLNAAFNCSACSQQRSVARAIAPHTAATHPYTFISCGRGWIVGHTYGRNWRGWQRTSRAASTPFLPSRDSLSALKPTLLVSVTQNTALTSFIACAQTQRPSVAVQSCKTHTIAATRRHMRTRTSRA